MQNKANGWPKNNRIAAELLIMVCEQFEVPQTHIASFHCSSAHIIFPFVSCYHFLRRKKAIFHCYYLALVRGIGGYCIVGGCSQSQTRQFNFGWHSMRYIQFDVRMSFEKCVSLSTHTPAKRHHVFVDRSHRIQVSNCTCRLYILPG